MDPLTEWPIREMSRLVSLFLRRERHFAILRDVEVILRNEEAARERIDRLTGTD